MVKNGGGGTDQVPARGLAGVAQLVVGGEDNEDLGGVRHVGYVDDGWMDGKCVCVC